MVAAELSRLNSASYALGLLVYNTTHRPSWSILIAHFMGSAVVGGRCGTGAEE